MFFVNYSTVKLKIRDMAMASDGLKSILSVALSYY